MTGIVDEGYKGDRSSLVARDTPFDSLAKPTTSAYRRKSLRSSAASLADKQVSSLQSVSLR